MVRLLESVFDHQMQIVPLVENLALRVGVDGLEAADLLVLLGYEFLVHRRDLDEQVIVGKVEIGGEPLGWLAFRIKFDWKTPGLVVPWDTIEVEKEGELPLTVVSEFNLMCRGAVSAQGAPVSIAPANFTSSGNSW
jgi:hypothetical protein